MKRNEVPDDVWYDRPINPAEYDVFGFDAQGGGRAELQVCLPLKADVRLIKKLDDCLNSQGMVKATLFKRTYWCSTSIVSMAKKELAAKIIRGWMENSGWART